MHHQQDHPKPWPRRDETDCMPSLLSRFVHAIWSNQAVLVLEYPCGKCE